MTPDSVAKANSRHDLDDAALSRYLAESKSIPGLRVPVVTTKIGYGQSNPTYYVDDAGGARYILRKKPAGVLISPVAHQVDREYRVLKALGTVEGFPVPKVYTLCMDSDVIGTPFYVMEFVKGRIITDPDLGELSPSDRRKSWHSLISTLAWLHSIDPDTIGLSTFGKKTSFYARHCNTFSRIEAQQAQVRDVKSGKKLGRAHEHYDEIVEYVRREMKSERYAVVHGDFKMDNVVLHPTEPRVIAILDWELSTIGNPLMDITYAISPFWIQIKKAGGRPTSLSTNASAPNVGISNSPSTTSPYSPSNLLASGMPSPNHLLDLYAAHTKFDPRLEGNPPGRDFEIAKVFHYLRGATISHGIQARTYAGQASSEFSYVYFQNTRSMLGEAWRMVQALEAEKKDGKARL